jgi:hypothetical protein
LSGHRPARRAATRDR